MKKIRVVITGASGFIGGHLVNLLSHFPDVEIIPVSRQKIPGFYYVADYSLSPKGDVLIHLAEDNNLKSVEKKDPEYENQSLQLLENLLNKKYNRVVYASSSILYGDRCERPHKPDDKIFVNNFYGKIKNISEQIVLQYENNVVVRLGNVYGQRMSSDTVVSEILNQISSSGDLVVADTTPVKDFIWVEDVVRGLFALSTCDITKKTTKNIFNLGSGVGTSIQSLARTTLDLSGQRKRHIISRSKIESKSILILDYSTTYEVCKWQPRMNLRDGIASMLTSTVTIRQ